MERIIQRFYHGGVGATIASAREMMTIDALAYAASLMSLLFTSDQLRIIYVEHNAAGVSAISWTWYTIAAFVWLLYGWVKKDRVLVITNALWTIFSALIVLGVAMYR
jgi:uncharacterized protein with PQ loop repeat